MSYNQSRNGNTGGSGGPQFETQTHSFQSNNQHFSGYSQQQGQGQQRQRQQNQNQNQNNNQSQQSQQSSQQKSSHRRTIDYFTPLGRYMISKNTGKFKKRQPIGKIRPEASYLTYLLPPNKQQPVEVDISTKFVHVSTNKSKHAIHAIKWTPDARRVVVSSHSGEFTLWNGLTFNFESIMQAHDSPIYSLDYSHNSDWLLSADEEGTIKYWQPNFNNVNIIRKAHDNAIQDLVFSPNDSKFVSCSDDQTLKIWEFSSSKEERVLKGHHWDVKCCDWHPTLGLIVSGSKDNLLKFWDPRSGKNISTLHEFKHTVTSSKFQRLGNARLLACVSRDHSTRILDLRMMKSINIIKSSNDVDLSSITWHPVHSSMLTIGGYDGSLNSYNTSQYIAPEQLYEENINAKLNELNGVNKTFSTNSMNTLSSNSSSNSNSKKFTATNLDATHSIPFAHDKAIHTIEYHPLGHILCSAGADKSMRFWCRSRPNDSNAFRDSAYTGESWTQQNQQSLINNIKDQPTGANRSVLGSSYRRNNNNSNNSNNNSNYNKRE
ncbi:hypothetical protein BVG19_g557 [[Candida] boidinii]|nr:hypothetical protein BVG19_g557 [[Candida] boidinii]OWB48470.1 hypothetical protein B5S27_g5 [[Candida] boidinii]